jgi:cation-transporting P-type ATPase E
LSNAQNYATFRIMNTEILSKGLKSSDVEVLRAQFGFNNLSNNRLDILRILIGNLFSLFSIITIIGIYIANFYNSRIALTTFVILLVINFIISTINTIITLKIKANKKETLITCKVIRDGELITLPILELVPQDIIFLQAGDITPADVTIIDTDGIEVEDINIDSIAINSSTQDVSYGIGIISGSGYAQVNRTGKDILTKMNSSIKTIFKTDNWNIVILEILLMIVLVLINYNVLSPKSIELYSSITVLIITIIITALNLFKTNKISNLLNINAKNNISIQSIETISKIKKMNLICIDKTGLLTTGEVSVNKVLIENQKLYSYLLKIPRNQVLPSIDEVVIDYASKFASVRSVLNTGEFLEFIPFDSNKRLSGYKFKNGTLWFGSPKKVMSKLIMDELAKLDLLNKIEQDEQNGLKAIGIGWADSYDYSRSYLGTYLILDPIQSSAIPIIQKLKSNGVTTKIISSDSLLSNLNIALETGIALSKEFCINSIDLNFSNLEVLQEQVKFYTVFANTNNEQKSAIIEALKLNYNIGYIGDGNSDTIPLNKSDIAIVKDSGTTFAKNNADVVFDGSNFESLQSLIIDCKRFDIK